MGLLDNMLGGALGQLEAVPALRFSAGDRRARDPRAPAAALIHLGGFWLSLAHAPPAQIDSALAARIAAFGSKPENICSVSVFRLLNRNGRLEKQTCGSCIGGRVRILPNETLIQAPLGGPDRSGLCE